jgi:DNA-directed RNA polymerase specialized sigma24 family protein
MDSLEKRRNRLPKPQSTEQLLESYYEQLSQWALVLTRGDRTLAEDIVQDLCLHFSLSNPDLSEVQNLDGYLYISLRNLYLSGLARSARESAQFVSIADFDSADFALAAAPSSDLLQRQNDLIRVSNYAVWRKESSKSASYFILHFFHGYFRREVAAIAKVPMAAIYNKLKLARTEIKTHLTDSGKIQIATRVEIPTPKLLLSPVPATQLFGMIRSQIMEARHSQCLPKEDLLRHYQGIDPTPISCALLSHIVSCDRCLELIARDSGMPALEDKEPLDILDGFTETAAVHKGTQTSYRSLRLSLEKKRTRIFEHRPEILSIAVNGKIAASHDVQGSHNRLSSRIEHPEGARFVEVFSDQNLRLAFLPVQDNPPDGPHRQSERVNLSDGRWLELVLSFDGLGLECGVAYVDPALSMGLPDEVEESDKQVLLPRAEPTQPLTAQQKRPIGLREWLSTAFAYLRNLLNIRGAAWAAGVVGLLLLSGYIAYRTRTQHGETALTILHEAVQSEEQEARVGVEEQTLELDVVSRDGVVTHAGTIERMQDVSGDRVARRFFDTDRKLLASAWHTRDRKGYVSTDASVSASARTLLATGLWKQDLAARAFEKQPEKNVQQRKTDTGFEVRVEAPWPEHSEVAFAVLELDHSRHPVRLIAYMKPDRPFREIRYTEKAYRCVPASSLPDSAFTDDPGTSEHPTNLFPHSALSAQSVSLTQLHIAVLYQLNQMKADVGEPIEVVRTDDGHIRIAGSFSRSSLRTELERRLALLPNHDLVQWGLSSPGHIDPRIATGTHSLRTVFDAQTSTTSALSQLKQHFLEQGTPAAEVNTKVIRFSQDALAHSQHVLQEAYALNRLGEILVESAPGVLDEAAQEQWTEMVNQHSAELEQQLRALQPQLEVLSSKGAEMLMPAHPAAEIRNPTEFIRTTRTLLRRAQDLEHNIGIIFANGESGGRPTMALIDSTLASLPIRSTQDIRMFAENLASITARSHRESAKASIQPQ